MSPDHHMPPVPRLIFLTWKVRQIPRAVQRCVESFQRRNPHWTVVIMSDADCLKWLAAKRPADLAWYEALPKGILRADAMRLLWLHEMGGIYADIDVECLRPLDGLAAMLGDGEWLALTRDHPVHERIHFHNTPMWMNDFMVARPGAPLIGVALKMLAGMVAAGFQWNPRNAVMETGPGLLNRALTVMGGLKPAGVRYVPWEVIHPLPDMTNPFEEKEAADAAIRGRTWRGVNPWVAHYWYHTWCSTRNMVLAYSDCLFADRHEAAMERLEPYRSLLGPRSETVGAVLEKLAAQDGPVTLIELGVARSFITEPPPGVDGADPAQWQPGQPAAWDWGAGCFTRVAVETLAGYDFEYHGVDPSAAALDVARTMLRPLTTAPKEARVRAALAELLDDGVLAWAGHAETERRVHLHEQRAAAFLADFDGQADLIYMDHGECSEETAAMHARDAQIIIERGLVKEGGIVLIDDHAHDPEKHLVPKSRDSRRIFEAAGWMVVLEGRQLLLQRPYEVPEYIPRILHVFCDSRRQKAYRAEIAEAWRKLHPEWEVEAWDDDRVRDFIMGDCPAFLEPFVSYRTDRLRMAAGKLMVLKKRGGIAVDPNLMPLRSLDELLPGLALIMAARYSRDQPEFAGAELVHSGFLASCAEHPFWDGLEHDLRQSQEKQPDTPPDSAFLTARLRDGLRFLSPDGEWPELLDHRAIAASPETANEDAWLSVVPHATLSLDAASIAAPAEDGQISISVMTVERPQAYIHDTIASLRKEWTGAPPSIFAGSPGRAFLDRYEKEGCPVHGTGSEDWERIRSWNVGRKAHWNYWRCLSFPADQESVGRMIFEDDVKFAVGWKGRFYRTLAALYQLHGPCFVLALYSVFEQEGADSRKPGQLFTPYNARTFMGTQGMFFPEPVRRDFAEYIRCYGVEENLMPYDLLLGHYCEEQRIPMYMTLPSLVQHTGKQTTGQSGGSMIGHTSPTFVEDLTD